MSTIDLIVLGLIKKQPISAYDIQKTEQYRNISRCVKISTPSIYKKVIQLEEKGYIQSYTIKEEKIPPKTIYSLTEKGDLYFFELMDHVSNQTINIFLDFNAVIVNLDNVPTEEKEKYLNRIKANLIDLKELITLNISIKEHIPLTGKCILNQQLVLSEALENWISNLQIENSTTS